VAIADVFDALSTQRVYKESWDESDVLAKIEEGAGRHFDPELVEIFLSCLDIIRSIQRRYQDEATNV
jgi:putative two-component system response regulator